MRFQFIAVIFCVVAVVDAKKRAWGDALPDYGVPDYSCPGTTMHPSKTVPTNVNSVRPADIKIVAALGDSLTAANGAAAEDPAAIILQYRGLAFQIGGDKNLSTHVTIPNILKKYNPNLFGQSYGIGTANVWEVSQLNFAQPGAMADDLPRQAREIVARMRGHSEVDFQNDWKLVQIFIGGNDMCNLCRFDSAQPARFGQYIAEAVQIFYDQVPRVIVSITSMFHLEMVRQIESGELFCSTLHLFECKCETNQNWTLDVIAAACTAYQQQQLALQTSGQFERDDFTYVIQPMFNELRTWPTLPNGNPREDLFAPDCFHFSQLGHALVSTWLWKNILEPVGAKTDRADIGNPTPLACPNTDCPFIRTVRNSANCAQYMTEAADY